MAAIGLTQEYLGQDTFATLARAMQFVRNTAAREGTRLRRSQRNPRRAVLSCSFEGCTFRVVILQQDGRWHCIVDRPEHV